MIIPDQSHINRVREALWQQPEGCATVMVGAGFSRNARLAGPQALMLPLWSDIAKSLCGKLYPSGDGDRFKNAMAEASGTSEDRKAVKKIVFEGERVDVLNVMRWRDRILLPDSMD